MKNKKEIIKSPNYWFEKIQNEFFRQFYDYIHKNNISQVEFAQKLNVTKGYISQILNGNFNPTLKKLIELSIAINKIPDIHFKSYDETLSNNIVTTSLMDILIKGYEHSCFQINDKDMVEIVHSQGRGKKNFEFSYELSAERKLTTTLN